jgi:hypothetical protein
MNLSELPSNTERISASRAAFTASIRSVKGYSFFTSCGMGSFLWKFICIVLYLFSDIFAKIKNPHNAYAPMA